MKVTRKELERIAALCKLKFTDGEYSEILEQFEKSIADCEILFNCTDSGDIVFPPQEDSELDCSLSFCKNSKVMS